jgi:predicted transcriptional regulator
MRKHLAIFNESAAKRILAGLKKIESRFSQKRIAPFGVVEVGDLIYIKPIGKDLAGQFRVKKVLSFEGLEKEDWELIKLKFGKLISFGSAAEDEKYFRAHQKAKYATLIWIDQVEQFITPPVRIEKSDQRGWMVLT